VWGEDSSNLDHHPPASRVGHLLAKDAPLRLLTSSLSLLFFRFSSPPHNPVYGKCVDPSASALSLSSHRYSIISLLFYC
jgi:hypothetical protein